MSFSYHKKFYNQTNKSSDRRESLENINFTPLANIQQIKMYDKYYDTSFEIPFLVVYYLADTLMRVVSEEYKYLYFPLTILAVICYLGCRTQRLKYKKYCLGLPQTCSTSLLERFSIFYININSILLTLLLPCHIVILLSSRTNIIMDIIISIFIFANILARMGHNNNNRVDI